MDYIPDLVASEHRQRYTCATMGGLRGNNTSWGELWGERGVWDHKVGWFGRKAYMSNYSYLMYDSSTRTYMSRRLTATLSSNTVSKCLALYLQACEPQHVRRAICFVGGINCQ